MESSGNPFDMSDPFGSSAVAIQDEPQENSADSFDLDSPRGDDMFGSEAEVSADNPFLDHSSAESTFADSSAETDEHISTTPVGEEQSDEKKTGILSGLFGGKKKNAPKEKEKQPKAKKEKVAKEKKPAGETTPLDWGTVLCIAFSAFLLVSLLVFNIAAIFTAGTSLMQTLCFLGAFNVVGLVLVAVPLLFYKFPKERTLPNVLLGISVAAMFTGIEFLIIEFSRYSFIVSP